MGAAMDRLRASPHGRELLTPGGRLYLLVGIAALAAFYAMPYDTLFQDTIYYPALGLASVIAIVGGVAWYRPAASVAVAALRRRPAAVRRGRRALRLLRAHRRHDAVPVAGRRALPARATPCSPPGLWLLVRQRSTRTDWTSLIDAATVTVALGIVAWELLIVPYTRDDSLSIAEKLVSIAYPLGDVLLLAVAARLLFGTAVRTFSLRPDRRSRSSAC